ncbi:MAG TPA: hypothetical protein VGP71_16790, partial [Burkholderiales bacterium]|nr:hypothetical protein [Burkholderiales bacterium]
PASANTDPIIKQKADQKIDGELRGYYALILEDVKTLCTQYGANVPVLLHPYDHPIPDGRWVWGGSANPWSWLYPYITTDKGYDLAVGKQIMRDIIDKFHAMQKSLAAQYPNVTVVGTPGTLGAFPDYKEYWENELHPRPEGVVQIGKKFADVLNDL